jgi:Phage tail protein
MTDVITDVGTITATWTDPTGTVWELSNTSDDVGWFTPPGPGGWNATSYEIVTDPLARGGESVRFIRQKPAQIVWPLYVYGDTHLEYVARHRQIRKAFTSTMHRRAPGLLRVARPDGTAREIDAYYDSGLEGEAGEGWLFSKDAVTLYAPDGYWRDATPIDITHSYQVGANFLAPYPMVSDGLGLGETTINNPGDVTAWPTFTITGPMTAMSATNITTGYTWTLTYALLANEQITVTTWQPAVRGPAGQNLVNALNWPDAYLWWLEPDDNDVILNVSGASAGTTIQMEFYARYEGA